MEHLSLLWIQPLINFPFFTSASKSCCIYIVCLCKWWLYPTNNICFTYLCIFLQIFKYKHYSRHGLRYTRALKEKSICFLHTFYKKSLIFHFKGAFMNKVSLRGRNRIFTLRFFQQVKLNQSWTFEGKVDIGYHFEEIRKC